MNATKVREGICRTGFPALVFALVSMSGSVAVADGIDPATGWYLIKNCGTSFYDASTNMIYWAKGSASGTKGEESSKLIADEDYYVIGGRRFTVSGTGYAFPGASLTIGDGSNGGILYIRGKEQPYANLILNKGTVAHAIYRSNANVINYYDNIYIDASKYARLGDVVGDPVIDATTGEKRLELPTQFKGKGDFMVDASIGKSINLRGGKKLNINLSLNNILNNQDMITGGYEQNRGDNYADGEARTYKFSKNPFLYYANAFNAYLNIGLRF